MTCEFTILIVEDLELDRELLIRRLSRRGYACKVAEDGQTALAMIREDRPDLVLMDMMLPVLDGWQATQQIKADPETREIPIIGVSALAMSEDRERALRAGCDDYVTKPFDFKQLNSVIERYLVQMPSPCSST